MRVTPESLTLVQGELEERRGARPRIARIQKVDPWMTHAVVSAGLGLITTAIMVNNCHKRDDECRSIAKGFGLIFVTPPGHADRRVGRSTDAEDALSAVKVDSVDLKVSSVDLKVDSVDLKVHRYLLAARAFFLILDHLCDVGE